MNLCIKAEISQQHTGSLWRRLQSPVLLFLSTTTPLTTSFRHVCCDILLLTGWDTSAANPAGKYRLVLLVQFACLPWKIPTSHKQSENAVLANSYRYRWQFLNDGSEKQATIQRFNYLSCVREVQWGLEPLWRKWKVSMGRRREETHTE